MISLPCIKWDCYSQLQSLVPCIRGKVRLHFMFSLVVADVCISLSSSGRNTNKPWPCGFDGATPLGFTQMLPLLQGKHLRCFCLLVDICFECCYPCVGRSAVKNWTHHHGWCVSLKPRWTFILTWCSWLSSFYFSFCTWPSFSCWSWA